MKTLLSLLFTALLFCTFGQTGESPIPANHSMTLSWQPNDPIEEVATYNVYVEGTPSPGQTNAVSKMVSTAATSIELVALLRDEPNGVYRIHVTAVNTAGLESLPSDSLWIFWHYRPSPPRDLVVEFKR